MKQKDREKLKLAARIGAIVLALIILLGVVVDPLLNLF